LEGSLYEFMYVMNWHFEWIKWGGKLGKVSIRGTLYCDNIVVSVISMIIIRFGVWLKLAGFFLQGPSHCIRHHLHQIWFDERSCSNYGSFTFCYVENRTECFVSAFMFFLLLLLLLLLLLKWLYALVSVYQVSQKRCSRSSTFWHQFLLPVPTQYVPSSACSWRRENTHFQQYCVTFAYQMIIEFRNPLMVT
jgi:hypothetical protein